MLETALFPNPNQAIIPSKQLRSPRQRSVLPTQAERQILCALSEFEYLTCHQVTRLLYAPSSLTHVREKLKFLTDSGFVLALHRQSVTLPRVYTLTTKGRAFVSALSGEPAIKRFRPAEEREKVENFYFITHTLSVIDVLIAARRLSQTVPGIMLNRLFTERSLKRKIYVSLPKPKNRGSRQAARPVCIEPDCSVDFTIQGTKTWQDFFHVEVYRHHLGEARFQQKIQRYVTYAASGQHEALFQTPALSIAVIATPPGGHQLAATLKGWTEKSLQAMRQPEQGERFFFCSLNPETASPTDLYLSPVWQQAFSTTTTPLLVLDEEGHAQ